MQARARRDGSGAQTKRARRRPRPAAQRSDPRLWDRRPLKKSLQEYAALDVRYMHALRDALHAKIGYSR